MNRKHNTNRSRHHFFYLILVSFSMTAAHAAGEKKQSYSYQDDQLRVRLSVRTAEQMAAFYEGRGFPKNVIEQTRQACFITVGIRNKTKDILWLDLGNWAFSSNGKPIQRIHREQWKQRWQNMQVPLNIQSTFRWTLLPETLDFRPDEREGGNITLARSTGSIDLHARFDTGADRKGQAVNITINNIRCTK